MNDTRKDALFTARLIAAGRIDSVSSRDAKVISTELVALHAECDALALDNERLRQKLGVDRPVTLAPVKP